MSHEPELYYVCRPTEPRVPSSPVEFLSVSEFLADEPACRLLWEQISTQFRTRSKFLAVWSGVQFVAVHRDDQGEADGFLLVNAPVNWQIDYVVVRPDARGRGIAGALVAETLDQAHRRGVPFVSLTSKPALRPLYESCGFQVVDLKSEPLAVSVNS
jgi:GNAT superfamily N-acetyltransferase